MEEASEKKEKKRRGRADIYVELDLYSIFRICGLFRRGIGEKKGKAGAENACVGAAKGKKGKKGKGGEGGGRGLWSI